MTDPGLLRFLDLVVRELGAEDARIELGGRAPEDPRLVFRGAPNGSRVVAVLAQPPSDRTILEARLDVLIGSFFSIAAHASGSLLPARTPPDVAQKRLDDELGLLRGRAGALAAVVFDVESPMVWGVASATPGLEERFQEALSTVRDAKTELTNGHTARLSMTSGVECLARPFAGIYILALLFDNPMSEPMAVGALVHALPTIERLVLALPPIDPPRAGAKVVRMPARLR
jgi:hypothetical protein